MFFGEAAKRFRYGGVNEPAPLRFCGAALAAIGVKAVPESFGPDSVWSYSLGEKGKFSNGRLLANATVFYIDWRDVQTGYGLSCGYGYVENKGNARSQGVELETKANVTETVTLDLSGSFTDARANGPIVNVDALDGDRVPYFPRVIATAGITESIPVPAANILLHADYTYRSNAYTTFNVDNLEYREVPPSQRFNATITYEHTSWAVGLYGTNLTNNLLVSAVEPSTFGKVQPGCAGWVSRRSTASRVRASRRGDRRSIRICSRV
jgi:outer membrane receptor protein involved in Fe transport